MMERLDQVRSGVRPWMSLSATRQWERRNGKEAIQTRIEDVTREKQAQRQGTRGSRGSQAEGRSQRLGARSRRRCAAERRPGDSKAGPRSERAALLDPNCESGFCSRG